MRLFGWTCSFDHPKGSTKGITFRKRTTVDGHTFDRQRLRVYVSSPCEGGGPKVGLIGLGRPKYVQLPWRRFNHLDHRIGRWLYAKQYKAYAWIDGRYR